MLSFWQERGARSFLIAEALPGPPWKQQMSEHGSLQISFTQHKRGKKQQPPASEILFAGPSEEHKGSVLPIL